MYYTRFTEGPKDWFLAPPPDCGDFALSQMINLVLRHLYEVIKPKPKGRRGKNRWIRRVNVHLGDEEERQIKIQETPEKQPEIGD